MGEQFNEAEAEGLSNPSEHRARLRASDYRTLGELLGDSLEWNTRKA